MDNCRRTGVSSTALVSYVELRLLHRTVLIVTIILLVYAS